MLVDALEVLRENETAVVIFTNGLNLDLDAPDGKASTAWWRMAERRNPEKVIIYRTRPDRDGAEVYKADYVDKERRASDGRFKVYLARVEFVGETAASWSSFVNGGRPMQSPIRYLAT